MEKKVYLFYGEDTFIIKSKINKIIQKYEVDDFNITRYDLEEDNIEDVVNDASTIPFMSNVKIVIGKNAYFLSSEKPKKDIKHNVDALKRYLEQKYTDSILILTAPYPKLDERKAITKVVKEHAQVELCSPLKEQDTSNWIRRQLGKQNLGIDRDALDEFMKRVENNTEVLVNEMQKLLQYAQGMNHISIQTIEKLITKNIEDNVYEITNKLIEQDQEKALEIYNDLVMHNEDPLRILGILVNKYREILHVKKLLQAGKDQADIAKYYNASSGRAYYMLKNAKQVSLPLVIKHLEKLEEIDFQIKSGQIDKRIGIELFILST